MATAGDHQAAGEARASLLLVGAALVALLLANSPFAAVYHDLLAAPLGFGVMGLEIENSVKSWIKNGLMAVFFFYVGLEIKAEFREGALADRRRAVLPFAAAAGGMAVPALVYLALAGGDPATARGWAIPAATDIAFAVGLVGLLGTRLVSPVLKAFLLAVAVIDDMGAILVIALFYTAEVQPAALGLAALGMFAFWTLSRAGVARLWPYAILALPLWLAVHQSGISPTLAGVAAALFVPLGAAGGAQPLQAMMGLLRRPVLFGIMPLFALANAGVSLNGFGLAQLMQPVTAGVVLGLLLGKPAGIVLGAWLAVATGAARLPEGTGWTQVAGIGCVAGIGFTMSLLIGALAFGAGPLMDQARFGVLLGSAASALLGAMLLYAARRSALTRDATGLPVA
ncbi:Na+/H+ antiporter NhaA [Roseicella aquatilis]|uniref:Na(+)/H(+) antiporter NhaA n=1 Tax=Roseicella aquatilis TaxID=2527868 RepID=A0A4R4D2Z6_9PROT|nr:Na+/H+ antiporter NhaA [Roseicella aquatilis]TCZ53415.1 Na+/H+ antiporter NhaA [Roseicella aquatilis]